MLLSSRRDREGGTSVGGGRLVVATMRDAGIPVAGVRSSTAPPSGLDRLTAEALVGVTRLAPTRSGRSSAAGGGGDERR
jgi:hypothetical protein